MEDHHHLQPLIPTPTTTTAITGDDEFDTSFSGSSFLYRLFSIFLIAVISVWANYEASKGFKITVINDAGNSPAGRRFTFLFISNDKATRIVLKTSGFTEKILYPDKTQPKKEVDHITVKLAGRNLTHPVIVNSIGKNGFILHISSSVMEEIDVQKAMVSALQRGMARVWLWDGGGGAPGSIIDGMVEYIFMSAEFDSDRSSTGGEEKLPESDTYWWEEKDPVAVANFFKYCEEMKNGFVGRLNQAMRYGWNVELMDEVLGLPAQQLWTSYLSSSIMDLTRQSSLIRQVR